MASSSSTAIDAGSPAAASPTLKHKLKHNAITTTEEQDALPGCPEDTLRRALSARQVQMFSFAGVIGTGLFIGSGKALETGGPGSLLVCYTVVGAIVYLTMLSLGEMAAYMPISGSFCTFSSRFIDDAFGFTMTWISWFAAPVSMAADLVALQILIKYWTLDFPGWPVSLVVLVALVAANLISVRLYGEIEYWLGLLKVVTVVIFMIVGIVVNAGANTDHHYIGGENWRVPGGPFVGGAGGLASVFVSASLAYSGTESITFTAGETKNPTKTIPRAIKNVFWRVLLFYVVSVLLIGLNISYLDPRLLNKERILRSPFTIILEMAGARAAGSFINAVIFTSAVSAGNHSIYIGGRLLYTLAIKGEAPRVFAKLTKNKVPWASLLATAFVSCLCFASSFVGSGQLWLWLQNLLGVSGQINWVVIGVLSIRFRAALKVQKKTHLLPFRNWTYPVGPWICVVLNTFILLVQGWTCFTPKFDAVNFVSFYIQLPVMLLLFVIRKVWKKTKAARISTMDLDTDALTISDAEEENPPKDKMERMLNWFF